HRGAARPRRRLRRDVAGQHRLADPGDGFRRHRPRAPRPFSPCAQRRRPRGAHRHHQEPLRGPTEGDLRMLTYAIVIAIAMVVLAMFLNLFRMIRGPRLSDRVLALDTLSINTIALVMLFGIGIGTTIYFEAALLIAM